MRRKAFAAILLFLTLLTACGDAVELNRTAVAVTLAVDFEGERFFVTAEILKTEKSNDGERAVSMFLNAEGPTFSSALSNLTETFDRTLLFSHNKVLILGRNAAAQKLDEITDLLKRDINLRETNTVMVSKEPTAADVMVHYDGLETNVADYLIKAAESRKSTGETVGVKVYELIRALETEGKDPVTGTVALVRLSKDRFAAATDGLAVFKNNAFHSFMDADGAFLYNLFSKNINHVEMSEQIGGAPLNIMISSESVEKSARLKDDKIIFECSVRLKVKPLEASGLNTNNAGDVKALEDAVAAAIVKKTEKTAAYTAEADIFGIGRLLDSRLPRAYDNGRDFEKACKVTVKAVISSTGTIF